MFGKWKKAAAVILPGILLMGMLSGCGKGSQKSSSAKNSITISLHQDPPKLDPMLSTAFVQRNAARRAPAAPAPEPPRPPRRAPQPAPRSRVNREPREEDPGLEMISRRPPKQKFANFEEYMAAHGGATAPIAGEGPLPELVPEFHLLSVPAENLVPAEDDE